MSALPWVHACTWTREQSAGGRPPSLVSYLAGWHSLWQRLCHQDPHLLKASGLLHRMGSSESSQRQPKGAVLVVLLLLVLVVVMLGQEGLDREEAQGGRTQRDCTHGTACRTNKQRGVRCPGLGRETGRPLEGMRGQHACAALKLHTGKGRL